MPTTDFLGKGVQSEHFLPEPGAEVSTPDITIINANCTRRQRKHRERRKGWKDGNNYIIKDSSLRGTQMIELA